MNRTFEKRYFFTGQLVLKTGLHIGGGETGLSVADNPIIRTPDDQPYIPGSSFKGAFRSTVEKLASTLDIPSCGLMDGQGCPGAPDSQEQKLFNKCRRDENWSEKTTLRHLTNGINLREKDCVSPDGRTIRLCDTCRLFGSPYAASKISFSDLYLAGDIEGIVQIRDGVAIDRDSEKAIDRLLYNYEVVAPTQTFTLEILLEDPTDTDLRLACLGLSEFISGFGGLGGKRSRGLGHCVLENLEIYELDLTVEDIDERAKRLCRYLLGKKPAEKMTVMNDVSGFIDAQITALLD